MDIEERLALKQTIEASMEYAAEEISSDTILNGLDNNNYQSWCVDDLSLVTCVVVYERVKRLRICYCHGSLTEDTIVKALDLMETFAKSAGCEGVEIFGRKGWAKTLRDFGYKTQYTILMKRFT